MSEMRRPTVGQAGSAIIVLADRIDQELETLLGSATHPMAPLALAFALGRALGRVAGDPAKLTAAADRAVELGQMDGARAR